jgi:glycolate oxidase FAD binding subunit
LPTACEPETVAEASAALQGATSVSIDREGGELVLRTARLNRLVEHEPGDLTCVVEAGIRLSELNERLAEHGQMLALDPPGDPTIGACIAANLSGPRRHRYGAPRDLVLGVTVVLADGTVGSAGGKVVKNVAGYDLGKLFCGSRGRLGLIARASLRLHPRPDVERTLAVGVNDEEEAQRVAQALLRSQLVPSALDLVWPGYFAVMFEGSARAVEVQLEAAQSLVGGHEARGGVWQEVRSLQSELPHRTTFASGALADFLRARPQALVRVAAGSAYVAEPVERAWSPLEERIRREFDPAGVLR